MLAKDDKGLIIASHFEMLKYDGFGSTARNNTLEICHIAIENGPVESS